MQAAFCPCPQQLKQGFDKIFAPHAWVSLVPRFNAKLLVTCFVLFCSASLHAPSRLPNLDLCKFDGFDGFEASKSEWRNRRRLKRWCKRLVQQTSLGTQEMCGRLVHKRRGNALKSYVTEERARVTKSWCVESHFLAFCARQCSLECKALFFRSARCCKTSSTRQDSSLKIFEAIPCCTLLRFLRAARFLGGRSYRRCFPVESCHFHSLTNISNIHSNCIYIYFM